MAKSKFYDYNDILSRQCFLNFVIGSRSIGKSYQMKKRLIKRFKSKREQFVYIRQNQNQIKDIDDWVGEVSREFSNDEFLTKHQCVYIKDGDKWVRMGYMIAVSAYAKIKSMDFSEVKSIVYDEFSDSLPWRGRISIPNAFLNELDTIIRLRTGVKVFLLGNAESIDNIFFHYFKIQPDPHSEWTIYRKLGICVNIAEDNAVISERRDSDFGRLIANTEYGAFALANRYADEDMTMIKTLPPETQPLVRISYNGEYITIWRERKNDNIYISQRDVKGLKTVTLDPAEGAAANYYKYHKEMWQIVLQRAVAHNTLYYVDVAARTTGLEILQKLGIY